MSKVNNPSRLNKALPKNESEIINEFNKVYDSSDQRAISILNGKMVKLVVRNPKTGPTMIEFYYGDERVAQVEQDDFFDGEGFRFNYDNIPMEG